MNTNRKSAGAMKWESPLSVGCVGLISLMALAGLLPSVGRAAISQQAYLKASNTGVSDHFGDWMSMSGDTLVVGASQEGSNATGVNGNQGDNSATNAGAAYVFVRDGTAWKQQAYLKASNAGAGDLFGGCVAVSGDTIVVGASWEDSIASGVNGNQNDESAATSGAAYIFVRNGTNWSQQAYLKPSNTDSGDCFGGSVAIWGDTVVIGAPCEDSNATGVNGEQTNNSAANSGAAYVFVRSGTNWSQQAYLKASNTAAGDSFGFGVDIDRDTIVVGAQLDTSSVDRGSAFVFVRNGTNWSQQAYLKANTGLSSQFGNNVAISGNTVVVADPFEWGGRGTEGAAYVFGRNGATWSQQAHLKGSNTEGLDFFGASIAVSGDTIVVGADYEASIATGVNGNQSDNSAFQAGAAYVFVRNGPTWSQQAYLKASNTTAGDRFGTSVAMADDTVVVSANGEDSGATGANGNQSDNSVSGSGAAYVFIGVGLPRPRLSIEQSAGMVRIVWPLPATDYLLEEVDALNASPVTGWSTVPVSFYQTNATHISLLIPELAGQKFYRLGKP